MPKTSLKKKPISPVPEISKGKVKAPARRAGDVKRGVKKALKGKEAKAKEPLVLFDLSADAPVSHAAPVPDSAAETAFEESVLSADAQTGKRPDRYFEAVGRRKTAVARARLFTKAGDFMVNTRQYTAYFPTGDLQRIAEDPLKKMKLWERFRVSVKVSGGGSHAQAEAVRHALARCLIKFNPDFRKRLKRAGYLTRDPRAKERKKFGLKKARRAPQWNKR